jgi:hypothetical protein
MDVRPLRLVSNRSFLCREEVNLLLLLILACRAHHHHVLLLLLLLLGLGLQKGRSGSGTEPLGSKSGRWPKHGESHCSP